MSVAFRSRTPPTSSTAIGEPELLRSITALSSSRLTITVIGNKTYAQKPFKDIGVGTRERTDYFRVPRMVFDHVTGSGNAALGIYLILCFAAWNGSTFLT